MSAAAGTPPAGRVAYDFAVLRAVPHVHLGEFTPVGVIVHARAAGYLGVRVLTDPVALAQRLPGADTELLGRYLASFVAVGAGDPAGGPIALSPPSERFHWLTAPRSDVLQSSPIHEGICPDPGRALDDLFAVYVARDGR
jgi:hypothetical protein